MGSEGSLGNTEWTICPDALIDAQTTFLVACTKRIMWVRDIVGVGTFTSRTEQDNLNSSQLCEVEWTAMIERIFNSLCPLTRTDLLLTQASAGIPFGKDAGNSATSKWQIRNLMSKNFWSPSCIICSYKCTRPRHFLSGQFSRENTSARMGKDIIWLPLTGRSSFVYSTPSEDSFTSTLHLSCWKSTSL